MSRSSMPGLLMAETLTDARAAQHHGTFMIEELIAQADWQALLAGSGAPVCV